MIRYIQGGGCSENCSDKVTYYFKLQFQIMCRKLQAVGLHPALGIALALLVFIAGSFYLFFKLSLAGYIYPLLALGLMSRLTESDRNDFLKTIFPDGLYQRVRVFEQLLVALPFLLFLGFKGCYWEMAALLMLSILLVFFNLEARFGVSIPTPFFRYPFEFTAGFRHSWPFYLLAYFLAFKAIQIDNFGLGIAGLVLLFLLAMAHYLKPETRFFVWVYKDQPTQFLWRKIGTAIFFASLASLPLLLSLSFAFRDEWAVLLAMQGLGYVFLATMVLAKYAAFPGELSVPQGILFGLSFLFPPMVIVVIPIFYKQALKRLSPILS